MIKSLLASLLLSSMLLHAQEKCSEHVLHKPMTLHESYFMTKEILKYLFITRFFIDLPPLQNIALYCQQCHYRLSALDAWAWIIAGAHEKLLNRFKKLLYRKASQQGIELFLLRIQSDPLFICPICCENVGWITKNSIAEENA